MMAGARRVTLSDVAAASGVSRATVSFVLNGGCASPTTRPDTGGRPAHPMCPDVDYVARR
ncbi:LacI family DNA-binding transcriptional regulator [Streptomyces mirabilis]|uniref:LacI family DNA-binding transcriptional regulator n=1 Tax=Streptomyces mirabilis TaxID=68239 RepID=UPI00363242C7